MPAVTEKFRDPADPIWEQKVNWLEEGSQPVRVVTNYGGDPTGLKDSTEAFKKAAAAGTMIYAPAGTYLVEGTLDISGKVLYGDGMGATILTKNGTSSAMFTVTESAKTTVIRNLTFTNSNHNATEGSYIKVEVAKGEAPVLIESIETKFAFHGIELGLSLFVTIARVWHYKWKGNAFWFHSGANAATIRDFYCQEGTTTACGIRLEGWNPGHIFQGGEVLNAGYGLYATIEGGVAGFEHRPEDCRFTDCFFDTIYGKKEVKNVGTVTEGSALVKMTIARSGINVGDTVAGTGVPGGSTVTEIKKATNEIKISANVEAGKSGTPTLTFTNGTKNSIVRCTQCSDMRFVNCWVAMNELTAKVVGFEFESCELMACVQCIADVTYYGAYFISACTSTSLTGCLATGGAAKAPATYQGNTIAHFMVVGGSKNTMVTGGNSTQSKSFAAFISPTSRLTDINGLGVENAAETPAIKNEIEAAKAGEVYTREGGKEGTLVTTEILTWLSAKVEEGTFPRAKIHAGNVEFRGTLKVRGGEVVKENETFMTTIAGYRPIGVSRRMRLAYGKEKQAPKELWVEVATNGEIKSLEGSPTVDPETHEPEGKVTTPSNKMTEVTSYVGIKANVLIEGPGLIANTRVAKTPTAGEEAAKELEMTTEAIATEPKGKYKFFEPTFIYLDESWFPIGKAGEN